MSKRVFITGMGILCSSGANLREFIGSVKEQCSGIAPLTLFPVPENRLLPAGQIKITIPEDDIPRTHRIAQIALEQFLNKGRKTDAVIIGVTTGGMDLTEKLLMKGSSDPRDYTRHGTGTVADYLASLCGCEGPVLTVSTACSSAAAAITAAYALIRSGLAKRVLTGGADSLCRLTYYGFSSLQVVDPSGARPLDISRSGMTVAEGASLLMLEGSDGIPPDAIAEILGGGLSCDAHHPASPHPGGEGAYAAMAAALRQSGLEPGHIDYISLHGTGTRDNDLAESKAIIKLFGNGHPPLSSVKGVCGHTLAASGAIEAALSASVCAENFIPPNTGCGQPDPALGIMPALHLQEKEVNAVLSNSFGFGGNNASLVISKAGFFPVPAGPDSGVENPSFSIKGISCLTGKGGLEKTMQALAAGNSPAGVLPSEAVSENINPREVRRMKRLPRMLLSLAESAIQDSGGSAPCSVFFGTGWGPVSETSDFLTELFGTEGQFASPTDFVGSVHNAPAGNVAVKYGAKGPNITLTGGDASFEQALYAASLIGPDKGGILLAGADEYHEKLSSLFDPSVFKSGSPADGGGALIIEKNGSTGPFIAMKHLSAPAPGNYRAGIEALISALGGPETVRNRYKTIFAGLPLAHAEAAPDALEFFISKTEFSGEVLKYRNYTGQFATAVAAAAALAAASLRDGKALIPQSPVVTGGVLFINFGTHLSSFEITP